MANNQWLSTMNENELWTGFLNSPYTKWSTACLLKYLGFRVLDSMLIVPGTQPSRVRDGIESFIASHGIDHLLVRTDAGKESGAYPQAGHSMPLERAQLVVAAMLQAGRAAILMLPMNRFSAKLVANLHMDHSGSFVVDMLGPGFDLADLNRGLISPEISVRVSSVRWDEFDKPSPLSVRTISRPIEEARRLRLSRIGIELLPAIGVEVIGEPTEFAEQWLRAHEYNGLFDDNRPVLSFKELCRMYEDAYLVGATYRRKSNWQQLVVGTSDPGDDCGRLYWDIANPLEKFRIPFGPFTSTRRGPSIEGKMETDDNDA